MANWDIESRPNIFPWPPVLLVIFIAAGLGLDRIMPLPLAIGLPARQSASFSSLAPSRWISGRL